MLRSLRSVTWVVINLAGTALYVYFGMALWVQPGEEGLPGGPGDAFYWILTQVPVAAFFCFLNFAALIAILLRLRTERRRAALYVWLLVAAIWIAAVLVDHHKVYREINLEYGVAGTWNRWV